MLLLQGGVAAGWGTRIPHAGRSKEGKNTKQKQIIVIHWVYDECQDSFFSDLTSCDYPQLTGLQPHCLLADLQTSKQAPCSVPRAGVSQPPDATSYSIKLIWVSASCYFFGGVSLYSKYQLSIIFHPIHCFIFLLSTYPHLIYYIIIFLSVFVFISNNGSPMVVGTLLFFNVFPTLKKASGTWLILKRNFWNNLYEWVGDFLQ